MNLGLHKNYEEFHVFLFKGSCFLFKSTVKARVFPLIISVLHGSRRLRK